VLFVKVENDGFNLVRNGEQWRVADFPMQSPPIWPSVIPKKMRTRQILMQRV
jgi:hypothetical protein